MNKKCAICGRILSEEEFYKYGNGNLDCTCKNCRKEGVRKNYLEKMKSSTYVEKERQRGRDKYKRLGYSSRKTERRQKKENNFTSLRNARRDFVCNLSSDIELHHWNYNVTNEVIAMDRRLHHRLHTNITLDLNEGIYYYNGDKLDTLEKHMNIIKVVCDKDGFDFSSVNVLSR